MDFAKQQLEKYGWKDGEGLGKNRNGISNAIKPKLKFDKAGVGHSLSDEIINPWWQRVYDSAADNIQVSKAEDSVDIKTNGETEVTTKRKKCKKSKEKYGNFVKLAALTCEGEQRIGSSFDDVEDDEPQPKKRTSGICDLTDEELFKACGGRTAHKGARHGLSMSAKLARSAQLENEALVKLKSVTSQQDIKETTPSEISKKKKKKKDKKKHHS